MSKAFGAGDAELLVELHALRVVAAQRYLVAHDQVADLDALQRLLEGLLVSVQLRQDGAELQTQLDLEFHLEAAHGEALPALTSVIRS